MQASMKKVSFFTKIHRNKALLSMLIPSLLLVIIFSYIPMGGIIIAFKKYNYVAGIFGSPWNGVNNFRFLFVSGKLWTLMKHTLLYNIAFISLGMVAEVGFAIMLNEMQHVAFKKISQSMMFLPHFISWVVVATIMLNIFGVHGVINNILGMLGSGNFNLYSCMDGLFRSCTEWRIS